MAYDRPDAPEAELTTRTDAEPPRQGTAIALQGVSKRFGRFPAVSGVDLDIRAGELLAVLGPSGSGKTTLLRLIAGLEFPDEGRVLFGEEDVTATKTSDRRVGFVFQQYALFRHMTVAKNVAFGLDVRRRDKPRRAERDARVEELLKLVALDGFGRRYPAQLSGGQRQRVALARALAVSPRVLLLDEPFGALDATVRKALRRELRRIHAAAGVTTVFITHDQEEALELADRVAVLNHGRLEQVGAPEAVLNRPETAFVAGFVGQSNVFEGAVAAGRFTGQGLALAADGVADGPAQAFVRPDQFALAEDGLKVRVLRTPPSAGAHRLEVEDERGRDLELILPPSDARPEPGQTLHLRATAGRVFPSRR